MIKNNHLKSIIYKKVKNKKRENKTFCVFGCEIDLVSAKPRIHITLKQKVLTMKNYISQHLLNNIKSSIRKYGTTISRTEFCKRCSFLNPHTLRNEDSMLKGVITKDDYSQYALANGKIHYTIEAACAYLDRFFTIDNPTTN